MKKPEASLKRRKAALKRSTKRSKRRAGEMKKVIEGRILQKRKAKDAEKRKFKEHMESLMGR